MKTELVIVQATEEMVRQAKGKPKLMVRIGFAKQAYLNITTTTKAVDADTGVELSSKSSTEKVIQYGYAARVDFPAGTAVTPAKLRAHPNYAFQKKKIEALFAAHKKPSEPKNVLPKENLTL